MAEAIAKREEIPVEKRWAVEDIYASDQVWEEDFKRVSDLLEKLENYKGKLAESAQTLKDFLDFQIDLEGQLETLYIYAHLNSDVDTTNNEYQSMLMRAQMLFAKYAQMESFSRPEIMEIPAETLKAYRSSDEGFALYDRFFEILDRERAHIRSKEVEELLASAEELAQSPSQIFSMFNNADVKFPKIVGEDGEEAEVTHGRYVGYLESTDRSVRKAAFESMYSSFGQFVNTIAANYAANIRQAIFYAKARGYASTRQMYLSRGNVPEEVYDNLIEVVQEGLPHMYEYVKLRKKLLQVEELHLYDVYVPIISECKMKVSFEEAKETIFKALAPMGETYLNALKEGFENRWIDACENVGKRSGAYCSGGNRTHPYVLMTYKETLDNMFTLAHEMGHAMHSYFSNKTQPAQTAQYLIFVAEVASTCNEILLTRYLIDHTDDPAKKAYIINHFLDGVKGTLFRQTMFAEFEMKAHKMLENGEALTADALNAMYYDLNKLYFGPDMVVDEEIRLEWARIPHFYTPFYVYQYATGISAAAALSERILKLGEEGVADYMKFLNGGGSKDPIDLLKLAGVDMSKKEPVQATIDLFADMLTELKNIVL